MATLLLDKSRNFPGDKLGVSVTFPNNGVFGIWIDPDTKDWAESKQNAGIAEYEFEEHHFRCWGEHAKHAKHAFNLGDGTKCVSAYICDHPSKHNADNDPVKEDPMKKQVADSKFTMSKDQVTVAFGNINDALEDFQCKEQSYKIGSDCETKFDCLFTLPNWAKQLAMVLTDAVAPVYHTYKYPTTGTVLMRHYTTGDENSTGLQAYVKWSATCAADVFYGSFCGDSKLKNIADVATGITGGLPWTDLACLAC
ncbi:uncharacterized protein CTRU02_206975 [Colletotrichum truncatum]|uniref:Uncharacterized protein n=1 Tax=Colletotrichum truncatum TaxID=5467 RepID=A0ACC3YZA3_COLTU